MRPAFWAYGVFRLVVAICVLFFVLTAVAMLLYPGGRVGYPQSAGYSFFENFFSDLGQTHTHSGASNLPSMLLLTLALCLTGLGLALFFIAFARLFHAGAPLRLGRIGAVCGVVAAICFVGVAFTPWNLYLQAHNVFVQGAFRFYLVGTVLFLIAALLERGFPKRFAWIFGGFTALLVTYVALLAAGPQPNTPEGALVQATGQKIIVYASILTIFAQAMGALSLRVRQD